MPKGSTCVNVLWIHAWVDALIGVEFSKNVPLPTELPGTARHGCTNFLRLRETIEESARRRRLWQYWAKRGAARCPECNTDFSIGSWGCKPIGLQGRVWGRYRTLFTNTNNYLGRCPDLPRYPDNKAERQPILCAKSPTDFAPHPTRRPHPHTPPTHPTRLPHPHTPQTPQTPPKKEPNKLFYPKQIVGKCSKIRFR